MAEVTFTKIKAGSGGSNAEVTIGGEVYNLHIRNRHLLEYHTNQVVAGATTLPAGAHYVEVIEQGATTLVVNNTTVPANGVYTNGDNKDYNTTLDEVIIDSGTYQIIVVYPAVLPIAT